MTNKNKNNSIIFLTTLSVYLGLVLVGGATHSSAQTVLQDRAEVSYLTDEKIIADYVATFQTLFILSKDVSANYSEETKKGLGDKIKDGKFQLNCLYRLNPDLSQSEKGIDGWIISSAKINPSLAKLYKIFPHSLADDKSEIKINLLLSDKDFSLKVTVYQDSDEQTEQIFNSFVRELSRIKIQQTGEPRIIYQNIEIFKENNQILIATRLPRGSLDALLKQDAKAEK